MAPTADAIVIRHDGDIATIQLNRPGVMNACDGPALAELRHALAAFEVDSTVRAVVLTGAGKAFCAGADLAAPRQTPEHYSLGQWVGATLDDGWNPLLRDLKAFPKPTVAAVNGVAAGGGVGLALSCDVTIAARSAYFKQVFVPQLAIVPDAGNTWHLPRLIGQARSKGVMLLGDDLDAETAADWGLIWSVVDDDALGAAAHDTAIRLAANSMPCTAALKQVLDQALTNSFGDQLNLESATNKMLGDRPGFIEGRDSFLEKRKPSYRNAE